MSNITGLIGYGENFTFSGFEPGSHLIILVIQDGESSFETSLNLTVGPLEDNGSDDEDGSSNVWIYIALIIIFILIILVIVILYLLLKREKEPEEEEIEEPETLMGDDDGTEDLPGDDEEEGEKALNDIRNANDYAIVFITEDWTPKLEKACLLGADLLI